MKLSSAVPKTIAGAAMAGIGLSLGRDIYKSSKNSGGFLLAVAIFVAALWLYVQSWTWLFRNYRSPVGSILVRIFSIPTLVIGLILTSFSLSVIAALVVDFMSNMDAAEPLILYTILVWSSDHIVLPLYNSLVPYTELNQVEALLDKNASIGYKWIVSITIWGLLIFAVLGIKRGISQRKSRALAWEAEEHNQAFMDEIGLSEISNNQFIDDDGNRYRLENEFRGMIELFPIGRRNRRAYIEFDENGKFINWSGIIKI
ncbi:hypothetical protein SAMN06297229_2289 [Pseudidiomarina planktonica]|uniref:Uncharacterized protein n=1 Tax=Pseudidiomarina planktonica TaxID=1323738 RepID=A0A1Y6G3K7_9GAMM|nr:hypothetical protein [Pseudidiomarina planktonica]RUO63253.1 hypothetical protein CWI77_10395 [Pseudidiomarina planktonica]SMQ80533.1 hypothetical protein SAMN06297229_2289 [Pseudidiomarina planktonica]